MSEYSKVVRELSNAGGSDPMLLPCLRCQTPTSRFTLSQYGARCQSCYDAYCIEPQGRARQVQAKVPMGKPHAEPLTPEQIEANKREADRKVAEYAKRNGLSLADSATLLQGGRDQSRAHAEPVEPAWVREGAGS